MRLKNIIAYQMPKGHPALDELRLKAQENQFTECSASSASSSGWVPPTGIENAPLAEVVDGHYILRFKTQTKSVPSDVIKKLLAEKCDAIFKERGRSPGKKEKKELSQEIRHSLLPSAFPKSQTTWVWINPILNLLILDCASLKRADLITTELMRCAQNGFLLAPLHTQTSPALAMTRWLQSGEEPQGFSFNKNCLLRGQGSAIRYDQIQLNNSEIRKHIESGLYVSSLSLSSETRPISFSLLANLQIKSFKFESSLFKGTKGTGENVKKPKAKAIKGTDKKAQPPAKDDSSFFADCVITTGEVSPVLMALIDSLDGLSIPTKQEAEETPQPIDS